MAKVKRFLLKLKPFPPKPLYTYRSMPKGLFFNSNLATMADYRYNIVKTHYHCCERGDYMDKYVEVFAASDITFAYLMKANLESAGIPVQIANENLQGAYCLDGMVPQVLVPASHAEQARQIIKDIQQAPQSDWDDDEQ